MNLWIFSSKNVEKIEVAKKKLLWGFWDKRIAEKKNWNWRAFLTLYNKIEPFDIVVFQIAYTGDIHALGIVKKTYYDDQTPTFPDQVKHILYPWKVSFCTVIFSNTPLTKCYVEKANYVDGFGIGELQQYEFRSILTEIQKKVNIDLNLG